MTDYGDLSTKELAKLITDEYAVILGNERTNLQKALGVGEKLIALRLRHSSCYGQWQDKLEQLCPTISYETATKYIRLSSKWEDIAAAARSKGVVTTELTIEAALKLIATPKKNKPDDTSKGKPAKVVKGGVEPGNEPALPMGGPPDRVVKNLELETGDMFEVLKHVYGQEELRDLTVMLAKHFGMTLMPQDTWEALAEAARTTPSDDVGAAV